MWGCGSLALADARCQSRSVSYQSHVARCPPLHVECSSSGHCLGWRVIASQIKNTVIEHKQRPLSNWPFTPSSVLPLNTLHEAAFAARPTQNPKNRGLRGLWWKTRGGPVFLMHFAGGPEGVVKNMKNTPPFLIIYRKNHLAIAAL